MDDDHGSDSGSAHVFVQNGDTWTYQAKLVAPDGVTTVILVMVRESIPPLSSLVLGKMSAMEVIVDWLTSLFGTETIWRTMLSF